VLGVGYEVLVAKLKSAPRPMMVHFLGLFDATKTRDDGEGDAAATAPAPASVTATSMADFLPMPAPAPASSVGDDATAIGGLIGGGVSFLGTGATPRPGMAARTGLAHHDAAIAAAAAEGGGDTLPTAFGDGVV